ncbi:MAG: hypothetical protein ACTSR8_18450 [Promethearchaeota archaeon]
MFSLLSINILSFSINVKAKEDIGVEENNEYIWEITKVDTDKMPQYEEGDQMSIKIEIIDYRDYKDAYFLFTASKDFDNEDDDPYSSSVLKIYENPEDFSGFYSTYFIPNGDVEGYLKDFADNHTNYEAKNNEIKHNSTFSDYTWTFNDDGVLAEYNYKYNDSTILSYELIQSGAGLISFGFEFLYFIPIGIIICLIKIKKKGGSKKT